MAIGRFVARRAEMYAIAIVLIKILDDKHRVKTAV